jgi:hypothetical protein
VVIDGVFETAAADGVVFHTATGLITRRRWRNANTAAAFP